MFNHTRYYVEFKFSITLDDILAKISEARYKEAIHDYEVIRFIVGMCETLDINEVFNLLGMLIEGFSDYDGVPEIIKAIDAAKEKAKAS